MASSSSALHRVLVVLTGACIALLLLTLAVPDWLETFGVEPDQGTGAVERALTVGFALGVAAFGIATWVTSPRRVSAGNRRAAAAAGDHAVGSEE